MAAAKTMVDELRIAHEGSSYPRIEAMIVSPTNGPITDAKGASRIIILSTFKA
jgi:hypothetical protein